MSKLRFLGLDVHADTIAVAVAERNGEVRSLGTIPNRLESVRKLIHKLGSPEHLRACYEAGPTGYALYWQLSGLGVDCQVIAPTLIPKKAGERVKTDRRDAEKLARCHRAGDLTAIWVPDPAHEALRDLVRAREAAKADQLRVRHRLSKFLCRHGVRPPETVKKAWTKKYLEWIKTGVHFEQPALEVTLSHYVHEVEHAAERIAWLEKAIDEAVATAPAEIREVIAALQALRGIAQITATTIVSEIGSFSRFQHPRELMAYSGLVCSEHSSGNRIQRGGITKTGNTHLRRVVVEAAWAYQRRPWVGGYLAKRQQGVDQSIKDMAWKAQSRLNTKYKRLTARGKNKPQTVTAVGRELLGFIWAIAVKTEAKHRQSQVAA
jgi:transposase